MTALAVACALVLLGGVLLWTFVGRARRRERGAEPAADPGPVAATMEVLPEPSPDERRPLRYEIDRPARLVRIAYDAYPSFEEWATTMKAVFSDPRYRPGFNFLFDRSGVRDAQSTVYIRQVSDFVLAHAAELRGSRLALVVPTLGGYGMGRMSGDLIAEAPVEQAVFSDVAKAIKWLSDGHRSP